MLGFRIPFHPLTVSRFQRGITKRAAQFRDTRGFDSPEKKSGGLGSLGKTSDEAGGSVPCWKGSPDASGPPDKSAVE